MYELGVIQTRCLICGARISRVRGSIVALTCLIAGLSMGAALIAYLRI